VPLHLVVNGEEREIEGSMSITDYLRSLGFDGRFVAVARNGDVLDRGTFGDVTLQDGDRLEIVRPVGGG
jgi:thiamine biosynthesis protein ThiS